MISRISLDKGTCFDPNHLIGFFIFAALHLGVGHLNSPGNFHGGKTVCRQAFRIQIHIGHTFSATVHTDSGTVGNVLQFTDDLFGNTVQVVVVHLIAVEGHIDDGNIVDFNGLDNPAGDPGRHLIHVLADLVVEFDETLFTILPHMESDRNDGHPGRDME